MNNSLFKNFYFSVLKEDAHDLKDKVKVFSTKEVVFLGEKFRFSVIGLSHCVSSGNYEYCELSSCLDLGISNTSKYCLMSEVGKKEIRYCNARLRANISIIFYNIKEINISNLRNSDLFYEFDNEALTAIKINDNNYETYHSYPEFDKVVYSKTEFNI